MEVKKYELDPVPRDIIVGSEDTDLFVTVRIGNGQTGGSYVELDDTHIAKGKLTDPAHIGTASDLKGKTVTIHTNILDINGFTNKCVLTTTFTDQHNQVLFSKIDTGEAPDNGLAAFIARYVIKVIAMLFLCLSTQVSLAQGNGNVQEFNSLETPTSPGFILLGETPAAIERPTTPQGLGLSILTFQQSGGAIEFAPYWLTDHPGLTAKAMAAQKVPILSHAALSLASVASDSSRTLAVGLRTRIYQSYGKQLIKDLDSIENAIVEAASMPLEQIDLEKLSQLRQAYVNRIEKRVFIVDLAAAYGAESLNGSYDNLGYLRSAVWLAAHWRPQGKDLYFTVLGRLRDHEMENRSEDILDLGVRTNLDVNNFTFSLEYLRRSYLDSGISGEYRLAAIGSYKVSNNLYFTSTFGKDFAEVNNILALAGINFGYSQNQVKAF